MTATIEINIQSIISIGVEERWKNRCEIIVTNIRNHKDTAFYRYIVYDDKMKKIKGEILDVGDMFVPYFENQMKSYVRQS